MGTLTYTQKPTMRVLALVDSSETSKNALIKYLKQHYKAEHELYLFHAQISPAIPVVDCTNLKIAESEIIKIMTAFNKAEADLESDIDNILRENGNVPVQRRIWRHASSQSSVGELAVQVADEIDAELVVTGSRGLKGIKKHWLGSVSDYVLRSVNCQVLINKL